MPSFLPHPYSIISSPPATPPSPTTLLHVLPSFLTRKAYLLLPHLPHPPTHPPTHSPTYPLIHLPTHPPTHSPTYPLTHLPTHPPTHSPTYTLPSNMPPSRSGPHPHPNSSPSHPATLTPPLSTYLSHLITLSTIYLNSTLTHEPTFHPHPPTHFPPSPTNPLSTLTHQPTFHPHLPSPSPPHQEERQHTRASEYFNFTLLVLFCR
ncbi:hypothetical protein Pcinc_003434 [Petrolisthes cinctipes]|uniref:Uncharacterized protein n=1 Tax=Petrolisthes cinctipes TaxID=88211 RepID=A0AAE1GJE4_PETCI|nr:hypothetical protein Pcinc_003434 [Petrolisthes cinctipes]